MPRRSGSRGALVDEESGVRGFVLAGQDDFLAPYTRGSALEQDASGTSTG